MSQRLPELFSIGHTTHTSDEFVGLLRRHEIAEVLDVRSQPYSRRLEQFNREGIAATLRQAGIDYVFQGRNLGASRDEPECYVGGQAVYDKIASLPAFKAGLSRLQEDARQRRVALMCAEKEPLDCHRAILVCRAVRTEFAISHILADGSLETHRDAEWRLVREMDVTRTLFEPDLSDDELVSRAYDKRATQIAYYVTELGAVR